MDGSDLPKSEKEAFDFSTDYIHPSEVAKIRYAVGLDEVVLGSHAETKSFERDFDIDDCYHVLIHGKAKTKDLLHNDKGRPPGINFEGSFEDGRRFLVKVGWWNGYYEIATAHERK